MKMLNEAKPLNHKPQALMMYNQPVPVQPNHALNDSTPWDSTNEGIVRRARENNIHDIVIITMDSKLCISNNKDV